MAKRKPQGALTALQLIRAFFFGRFGTPFRGNPGTPPCSRIEFDSPAAEAGFEARELESGNVGDIRNDKPHDKAMPPAAATRKTRSPRRRASSPGWISSVR